MVRAECTPYEILELNFDLEKSFLLQKLTLPNFQNPGVASLYESDLWTILLRISPLKEARLLGLGIPSPGAWSAGPLIFWGWEWGRTFKNRLLWKLNERDVEVFY